MKYRHIIWDYNGTLLNDLELSVDVMNTLLAKRNLPLLTIDRYRELFDFPVIDYYQRLGFDFDIEPFEIVGTEYIVEYDKRDKMNMLHEGTHELLEDIKIAGMDQSVLSAREAIQLHAELKQANVFYYFHEVVGLHDHYAGGKTEYGMRLINGLEIHPEQILMIGDTKHDAEVAKECGIDCVLLAHGHHSKNKLKSCGVDVLSGFDELKPYIFDVKK
jgi:phosphoglycolate phosphatase